MKPKNGLLVVLIESTAVMNLEMVLAQPSGASQRVSRCELLTSAVSRLLEDLSKETDFGVIIGGYALDRNGQIHKYSRAGVEVSEYVIEELHSIAASPLEIKSVSRTTANGTSTQQVPVHLKVSHQHESASQTEAFAEVQKILQSVSPSAITLINICCSESSGANPLQVVEKILASPSQEVQVINLHLGTGTDVPTKYPSQKLALRGLARQLFARSSEMSPGLAAGLKNLKQVVLKGARSVIVNASMIDVSELFSAVRHSITNAWPDGQLQLAVSRTAILEEPLSPSPETVPISDSVPPLPSSESELSLPDAVPPEDERGGVHVLFVVRPGVEDPYSHDAGVAVRKLLDVANDVIDSCHQLEASLSLVMISKDADGDLETLSAFPGDPFQSSFVDAKLVRESAVVVDYTESVSDGAGGLIEVPKKKHVYLRGEPGFVCSIDGFLPSITEAINNRGARKQFVVFFIAGIPTPADLLAIEALKTGRDCVCLACVWTVGAHSPVRCPLKDLSGLQNSELSSLASQCQVPLNGEDVFALSVNSSKGLSSLLTELAAVIV